MSYALILAQVEAILDTVSNVGNTHQSERITNKPDDIKTISIATIGSVDQVRVWFITRTGTSRQIGPNPNSLSTGVALPTGKKLIKHDIQIEGFMSYKDNDTEDDWQNLVDAVIDALATKITLNGTALLRGPIECRISHGYYTNDYCHTALITFWAAEWAAVTPS